MIIEQIRNATIRVQYGGKTFLIDPWLAPKDGFGCFAFLPPSLPFTIRDSQKRFVSMPICGLPKPVDEILKGIDYYIVTHIHPDHIDMELDGTLGKMLDKKVPLLVQNEEDKQMFQNSGFEHIQVLSEQGIALGTIRLTKAPAFHGTKAPCGSAMGIVMEGEEKTLYIAGDTIWYEGVEQTLSKYQPRVIILNACAAQLDGFGKLIMGDNDVEKVINAAPDAEIIISHMDNVAHATLSRTELEDRLRDRGVFQQVRIPEDGQHIEF